MTCEEKRWLLEHRNRLIEGMSAPGLYHLRSVGPCESLTDGGSGGFEPRLLQRTGVGNASPAWRVRSRRCYGPRTAAGALRRF